MREWLGFGKTYRVKCPGGHVAIIYRDVNDAFPFALSDVERKMSGSGSVASQADLDVSAEYRSGVSNILFAIDELNSSQIMDFRAAYSAFMSNPCENGPYLERASERIRQERNALIRLRMQAATVLQLIRENPDRSDAIAPLFNELLRTLNVPDAASTVRAIHDARAEAHEMAGAPANG
jgi:hypothetical protein